MSAGWRGAMLALLAVPAFAQQPSALPPPPEVEWVEHVPLHSSVSVKTWPCDEGHDEHLSEKALHWTWDKSGVLGVTGRVMHNGVERVEAEDIQAWLQGKRVIISYLVRNADAFPEAPAVACPGFTHFDIRITGVKTRPGKVLIYPSRMSFFPAEEIPAQEPSR